MEAQPPVQRHEALGAVQKPNGLPIEIQSLYSAVISTDVAFERRYCGSTTSFEM